MCMADKFPESLPGFQKMFPNDEACARYLEAIVPAGTNSNDIDMGNDCPKLDEDNVTSESRGQLLGRAFRHAMT